MQSFPISIASLNFDKPSLALSLLSKIAHHILVLELGCFLGLPKNVADFNFT